MIGELGLSFSRPVALLLLVLLVPLTVYLSRTSLAYLRRGARRWSLGLRLAIVALLVLSPLHAVSRWYEVFDQTSDDEVVRLLAR